MSQAIQVRESLVSNGRGVEEQLSQSLHTSQVPKSCVRDRRACQTETLEPGEAADLDQIGIGCTAIEGHFGDLAQSIDSDQMHQPLRSEKPAAFALPWVPQSPIVDDMTAGSRDRRHGFALFPCAMRHPAQPRPECEDENHHRPHANPKSPGFPCAFGSRLSIISCASRHRLVFIQEPDNQGNHSFCCAHVGRKWWLSAFQEETRVEPGFIIPAFRRAKPLILIVRSYPEPYQAIRPIGSESTITRRNPH